jgi:hypothetical protein
VDCAGTTEQSLRAPKTGKLIEQPFPPPPESRPEVPIDSKALEGATRAAAPPLVVERHSPDGAARYVLRWEGAVRWHDQITHWAMFSCARYRTGDIATAPYLSVTFSQPMVEVGTVDQVLAIAAGACRSHALSFCADISLTTDDAASVPIPADSPVKLTPQPPGACSPLPRVVPPELTIALSLRRLRRSMDLEGRQYAAVRARVSVPKVHALHRCGTPPLSLLSHRSSSVFFPTVSSDVDVALAIWRTMQ